MPDTEIVVNDTVRIPLTELRFRFDVSSGPGGQHANKAATRATLIFDVAGSASLDEDSRERLLTALASYLDKDGRLQIQDQSSRSQRRNRDRTIARFKAMLVQALAEPQDRIETQPSRAAEEKRLAEKKKRSLKKQERRRRWWREE